MRSRLPFLPLVAAALLSQLAFAEPSAMRPPAGGLQVLPTRVVLEGRERTAALTLTNTGDKPKTYRLSFVEMKMNEQGGLEQISASDRSLAPWVRFSPRQVTLQPKVSQTVRVQLRPPAELPAGEYRSHLMLRAVPDEADAETVATTNPGVELKLVPVYGVAIPVIYRNGEGSAQLSISELRLTKGDDGAAIELNLNRAGAHSGYGELTATWAPDRGPEQVLAQQKGVGIYLPNAVRKVRIALPANAALAHGKLRVRFAQPMGGPVITEAELPIR